MTTSIKKQPKNRAHRAHSLLQSALLCLLLLTLHSATHAADVVIDKIVAVVNDGIVLSSELEAETQFLKQQALSNNQSLPNDTVFRQRVLERLIDQEIQRQHAKNLGIAIDPSSVNRAVEQMARSNNMDTLQFRNTLQSQGYDYNRFRSNLEQELLLARLVQREVESQTRVSQQEIDDYLNASSKNKEKSRYHVQHILVAIEPTASEAEREKAAQRAQAILTKLRAGDNFAQTAAAESDGTRALEGGDLGWRSLQEMPEFLATALRTMQVNQISEPLSSQNGLHIVKLLEKDNGQQAPQTETLVRHIFIANNNSSANSTLQGLRQRILSGESFQTLAKQFSEDPNSAPLGGELPWFSTGQMPAELEQVANGLQKNDISQPFQTQFGWHLLQLLDRRTRDTSEESLRKAAEEAVRLRKIEQEGEIWMRNLRNESFIDIRNKS